ncbi:MAG: glycosyltransferase [Cyclobacteriaceae bacterium]|nr:glycosyltransferase [Cyclobacteriaceae bacterium]
MASEEVDSQVLNSRLGTITQTNHWIESTGEVVAYEPYVREMRIWADLFQEVEIFTPLTASPKKGSLSTYNRSNVFFRFVRYDTRVFRLGFVVRFLQLPIVFFQMAAFIWRHDFLLIRSPGHFSLLAHMLVVSLRKKSITKFAGYFGHFKGERIPSIFERYIVRNWLGADNRVLVYGQYQQPHLISFFPLLMSKKEKDEIFGGERIEDGRENDLTGKLRVYSLGRLLPEKGFSLAIEGLALLSQLTPATDWHYFIVGDGPEESHLRRLACELGVESKVSFIGSRPYMEAMRLLNFADVVLMPGEKEGWPKVVVEAWCAGAIPVCVSAGLLPTIIRHGENGFLFKASPEGLSQALIQVSALSPSEIRRLRYLGRTEAVQYTADQFASGVADLVRGMQASQ